MSVRLFRKVLVLILGLLALSPSILAAQNDEITLTLHLFKGMEFLESGQVFKFFEDDHPGIKVHVIYTTPFDFDQLPTPPVYGLDDYLTKTDAYSASADVVMTSVGVPYIPETTVESSHAGYYLDLAPLIQADTDFDPSVFYPTVWQSVTWDGGIWLLPSAAQIYTLMYSPSAFDERGLNYPDSNWGLTDFTHAFEIMTVRDGEGKATIPGYIGFNGSDYAFMYSLLGHGLYDETVYPNPPDLNQPDVIALAEQWAQSFSSGAIYNRAYPYPPDFSPDASLIKTDQIQAASFSHDTPMLYPGGKAALTVAGFSISSRTQYPQQAYELLKYLANDIRVADAVKLASGMMSRARPAYPDVAPIENAPYMMTSLSPETKELLEQALKNAIPASEVRYFDYLRMAVERMASEGIDAQTALQEMQLQIESNLQKADEQRSQIAGLIATPPPPVILPEGKIALQFRYANLSGLPNESAWDQFTAEFIQNDPDVGQIVLDTQSTSFEDSAEHYDCFYYPYNAVSNIDTALITSLDPLMSADATFDRDDLFPGLLAQVQHQNLTWAFPIDIHPAVLWYIPDKFAQAGVTLPQEPLTVDTFTDLLRQLKAADDSHPALGAIDLRSTLLMLIAAYGGLPIDYRTTPPTVAFLEPDNLNAIQQVLDLAKSGLIHYTPLSSLDGGIAMGDGEPIYTGILSGAASELVIAYPLNFPVGSRYTPVAYGIGTAYISASAQNPEACYRFISSLSHRPELLAGMPVWKSLGENTTIAAVQGQNIGDFYTQFANRVASPQAVLFPFDLSGGSVTNFAMQYWLSRAFDHYVLEDADLTAELTTAQQYTEAYLACVTALPAFDPAAQAIRDYNRQVTDCAVQVDPTSESYFHFGQ